MTGTTYYFVDFPAGSYELPLEVHGINNARPNQGDRSMTLTIVAPENLPVAILDPDEGCGSCCCGSGSSSCSPDEWWKEHPYRYTGGGSGSAIIKDDDNWTITVNGGGAVEERQGLEDGPPEAGKIEIKRQGGSDLSYGITVEFTSVTFSASDFRWSN